MNKKKLLIGTAIVCALLIIAGVVFQLVTAKKMRETSISLDPEQQYSQDEVTDSHEKDASEGAAEDEE